MGMLLCLVFLCVRRSVGCSQGETKLVANEGIPPNHVSNHREIDIPGPCGRFHTYSMEWNSHEIKIFFDDRLSHTTGAKAGNPFRKPFYILLNQAMAGSWNGSIDDTSLAQAF